MSEFCEECGKQINHFNSKYSVDLDMILCPRCFTELQEVEEDMGEYEKQNTLRELVGA